MSEFKQFEPQAFTTDFLGNGVRYRLPYRRLGRVRHIGWVVVGFGSLMILFMIAWMSGPVIDGLNDLKKGGGVGWSSIAFGCMGLFGLIPGLGLLIGGMAVISNRTGCEIQVLDGKIAVKEQFVSFRLRRKRAARDIHRLRIADAAEGASEKQPFDARAWLGDFDSVLVAETGGNQRFPIAIAYPREMLVRLADELAPRLEADLNVQTPVINRDPIAIADQALPRKIEVVEGPVESEAERTVPDQPLGSTAIIQRHDYGITIEIPPAGLWKGSKGLFFFALIWNALVSVFIVVGVLAASGAIEMDGDAPPWIMLLFMIPFVAVGAGVTIASINMGRRHATIATSDDLIMIVRHSIFGKTTREWSASQIKEIRCGNSGMEVNNVPVKELQIVTKNGKKFGCLSQLDDAELDWIAAELNQSLAIERPATPSQIEQVSAARDESGLPTPASGSRVSLDRTIDGVCIHVPPKGLLRQAALLIIGFVFAAIGVGIAIGVGGNVLQGGVKQGEINNLLFASVFFLSFGSMGAMALLIGLVAGRRQFQLTVEHDELSLLRRGPFARRTFRWHRDDLESVAVTDSGTQVNNRKLYQVFIRSRKGDSVGIMTGHDSADLQLVAAAVNESLSLNRSQVPAPA